MKLPLFVFSSFLIASCATGTESNLDSGKDASPTSDGPDVPSACVEGNLSCEGKSAIECRDGAWVPREDCEIGCANGVGCQVCTPNTGTCEDGNSRRCKPDGSGYFVDVCDPVQGLTCGASGVCEGACSRTSLGESYVGCDYFPTVTGNPIKGLWEFGVIISNTSDTDATVRLDDGDTEMETFTVKANSVEVKRLILKQDLRLCVNGGLMCSRPMPYGILSPKGAYRVRSDQPVIVYQFNPLDYTRPGSPEPRYSFSNDASLLLPTTSLGTEYMVVSLPTWPSNYGIQPGLIGITATEDDTVVMVDATAPLSPDATAPITLQRGDVLQLASETGDATGTRVRSDKPIQVLAGHYNAQVPVGYEAADHLEEIMIPVTALGNEYVVAPPASPPDARLGPRSMVRIVAEGNNTTLTYNPPVPGAPSTIDKTGGIVEFEVDEPFIVSSNNRILVSQFMLGQDYLGSGDPAMTIATPTDQWRDNYLFHAPTNYETNHVTVVAPVGASVTLDGQAITDFAAIGSTGYALARIALPSDFGATGDHRIEGSDPFEISVYGYGEWTSYWYPGGMDVGRIVID